MPSNEPQLAPEAWRLARAASTAVGGGADHPAGALVYNDGARALKRFALRHGGPPQSLDALAPEFLRSIPVDYMDGKPIKFRPLPTGGFVLYSVGEDGKDDGGDASLRPGKTNSRMIWDRNDAVWPAPATAKELQAYRAESTK